MKNPLGRISRLLNQLSDVSYEIRYVRGSENHLADFMSRVEHPSDPCVSSVNSVEFRSGLDWFKTQQNDAEIVKIIKLLKESASSDKWRCVSNGSAWLRSKDELYVTNGLLKYGSNKMVVPTSIRSSVLAWYHDAALAGHMGYEPVLASLRLRYFWPCMPAYVKEYCKTPL